MATVALINFREWFFLKEIPPPRHWLLVLFSFGFDYFCRRRCSLFEKEILWINWLFWFHEFFLLCRRTSKLYFSTLFWVLINDKYHFSSFQLRSTWRWSFVSLTKLRNDPPFIPFCNMWRQDYKCEICGKCFTTIITFVICNDKIINVKFVVNFLPQ